MKKKIKSAKDPAKSKAKKRRRKSLQMLKRNIQCQKISWSYWEGSTLLYVNIKY